MAENIKDVMVSNVGHEIAEEQQEQLARELGVFFREIHDQLADRQLGE